MLGTGFRIPCQPDLDSEFHSLAVFWIPWAEITDTKAQDSGFHKPNIFRIPESRLPYMGRSIDHARAWISSSFAGFNIENGRRNNRKIEKSGLKYLEDDSLN